MNVIVTTPIGKGGTGGIDRLMDFLRGEIDHRPSEGVQVSFWPTRGDYPVVLSPLTLLGFIARFLMARLRGRVDLLHINLAAYGSTYRKLVISRLARALGVPYVLHLHGSDYPIFWQGASPWLRRRVSTMFGNAARVIVLGKVWSDLVLEVQEGAKPVILMNATPPVDRVKVQQEDVLLLFLGRLGARKGVPELIAAAGRLKNVPGWRMIVAGDGEIDETRAAVAAHGLNDRVSVPGWVGPDEVVELYSRADVLVLPSREENLPMSVIEGMGAGLAVVTTPVGAVPEIMTDGENGLLVQPGNSDDLAVALERVIRDPDLRERLGSAAKAFHHAELSMSAYWPRLVEVWRSAAARVGSDRVAPQA